MILNEVSDHRKAVLLRHLADSAGDERDLRIWIIQDANLCQKGFAVLGKVLRAWIGNFANAALSRGGCRG